MGFLNSLTKLGRKIWDGLKKPISAGYHWLKDGMSALHRAGSWIDGKLTTLHNIPIVGELATLIQSDPLYQEVGSLFGQAESYLDLAGEIGRDVGRGVEGALGGLERARGHNIGISPVSGGVSRSNQLTERSIPNISPLSGYGASSYAIS